MKGKLIVISAPSGTGKTTICKRILNRRHDIVYSVSYTTRKPRRNEQNGIDYRFISENEFREKIKSKGLLEYANVYGNLYGTDRKFVIENLKRKHVLLDVDVQGARSIKRKFKSRSILIYLLPPSIQELKRRLKRRGELHLAKRLGTLDQELRSLSIFDYILVNKNINDTVRKINNIIDIERC